MESAKSILEKAIRMTPYKHIDETWAIEAEKRLKAYNAGKLKTLSFEEVFGED